MKVLLQGGGRKTYMAPPEAQRAVLEAATRATLRLYELDEGAYHSLLRDAARWFVEGVLPFGGERLDLSEHARRVAEATGIPTLQVVKASLALADALEGMEAILGAQGYGWGGWSRSGIRRAIAPAGQHLAVRIPDAHPAIHRTWLTALAMRRPVLLWPSVDVRTPARFIEALYAAGLPDGAAALCGGEVELLFREADQVLWSSAGCGAAPLWMDEEPGDYRVKHWHHGGSKALLLERMGERASADLAAAAMVGCGRLCTKLSALLVMGDAAEAGALLATALARWTIAPLDDAEAMVPAFPDHHLARRVDAIVAAAEARGAVDLSAEITGGPRLVELNGHLYRRPTVLLIDRRDPLFGAELPFPFVTVAAVPRAEMALACRGSLAVTVLGEDELLRRTLLQDRTIDRVHCGGWISGGDRVDDPHEGRLADFLFRSDAAGVKTARERMGRCGA